MPRVTTAALLWAVIGPERVAVEGHKTKWRLKSGQVMDTSHSEEPVSLSCACLRLSGRRKPFCWNIVSCSRRLYSLPGSFRPVPRPGVCLSVTLSPMHCSSLTLHTVGLSWTYRTPSSVKSTLCYLQDNSIWFQEKFLFNTICYVRISQILPGKLMNCLFS